MSVSMSQGEGRLSRRDQLLGVALEAFSRRGYHATTVADIIASAGVARGTFYNYFTSKEQIFATLLDQLFETLNGIIVPIEEGDPQAMYAQVRGNFAGLCIRLHQNRPMTKLLLEKAVGLDGGAHEQLTSFYHRVMLRLSTAVSDGQRLGIVRPGNCWIMATFLLGMIKEAFYQQFMGTETVNPTTLAEELFHFTAEGLLRAHPPLPSVR